MDSKEFKETCNIVVEPVNKSDDSLIHFLKDVEEAAIKVFEDGSKVSNFYKVYRQRICYYVNRQIFKANYQYLIEQPDLNGILKQLDYISFLRTNTTYDSYDLDDWESNFKQLENRYRETIRQNNSQFRTSEMKDKRKIIESYKWQGKKPVNDLSELYQLLNKHLSKETSLEQFKTIFSGIDVSKITPIKWHDDNASEVLYFIYRLAANNCIDERKNKNDEPRLNYVKLKACIIQSNGKKFTANFKELKQKIDIFLSKEKRDEIDKIVKQF